MLFRALFLLAPAALWAQPEIGGCRVFPADNVWNARIDRLPVHAQSDQYIQSNNPAAFLHADVSIPYVVVPHSQPKVPVTFQYDDESDPGPYPIPPDAPIEGGPNSRGDRHILIVDSGECVLYEVYAAYPNPDGTWRAGSGAIFDLKGNAVRPDRWTSADAAGLPILPGLIRYDEVASGEIRHAIRMTVVNSQNRHVWPARHDAGKANTSYPPMGVRFRLKSSVDESAFSTEARVIIRALKTYGAILADNGSNWFLTGVPDDRWNQDHLRELHRLHGLDFEAVDESSLMVDPNSAQARTEKHLPARLTHRPVP